MRPILPIGVALVDESQVCLVDQGGGLKDVPRWFVSKPGRRPPAQLLIDNRDQLVSRAEIAATPRVQQSRHIVVGDRSIRPQMPSDSGCGGLPSQGTPGSSAGRMSTFPANPRVSRLRSIAQAGQFCTITSSNLAQIEMNSRVIYASNLTFPWLDSDVVLDLPGPGNNKAFGHCRLDLTTNAGLCTFAGGTGMFTHFSARVVVSYLGGFDWAWDGTYSFKP